MGLPLVGGGCALPVLGTLYAGGCPQFYRTVCRAGAGRESDVDGAGVVLKATGAVIGDCAFYLDGDRAEIGCNISPAYQRRGLAREALQTLVAYCAEVYKVALIRGITDSRNLSSIRLQESLGMVRDRTFENRIQCKGETCTEYRFEGDCRAIFSPERTTI